MAAGLGGTALSGCATANDEEKRGGGEAGGIEASSGKAITIGYIDWDEDVAVTHLWKKVLENKGFKVTMQHVTDAGPVFVGLDKGQVDLYLDAWLPLTHKVYWDKYGKDLTDLGVWYSNAKLTVAVPTYMDIDSIDQIASVKGKVADKIVGIEPGAGLTKAAKKALQDYSLSGVTLQTSSTPAMLAALKKATDAKQPIVVTLWRPHWAYAKFPIKDLKDPKNSMGDAEKIHAVGRKDFAKDFPEIASMLKKFTLTDPLLSDLEKVVLQDNAKNPAAGVEAWLKKHPEFEKSLG
ncbi:hypothetical protein GCM10027579_03660 [Calidifontibacter terrae]